MDDFYTSTLFPPYFFFFSFKKKKQYLPTPQIKSLHLTANGQLALGPDGKGGELTAQEFLDRLQEYTDLNTRIHDQQQEQLDKSNLTILHSQYVKITPINPDGGGGGARQAAASPGTEGAAAAAAGGGGPPEDASACHGDAVSSGTCCALIFRETTV
uniref:Uncharacterized protein n=1 Tax=Anopheles gambiae TaxID=7165 RepID=A0A0E4G908_ANOGA